jgi:thiol-disulfide isomerase/thioredoxin
MSSFLTKIKTSGRFFFTSGFFTHTFCPSIKVTIEVFTELNKMIIKITFHDVHVRRSPFVFQSVSIVKSLNYIFNLRIRYGQREIQYYRVFFLFFILPQSRR